MSLKCASGFSGRYGTDIDGGSTRKSPWLRIVDITAEDIKIEMQYSANVCKHALLAIAVRATARVTFDSSSANGVILVESDIQSHILLIIVGERFPPRVLGSRWGS